MKKFIVPLQAFASLLFCAGLVWMVFVLAGINPVPPTAMDLKARSTQDLSFVNMNSTAVALAKEMLAEMVPSPTSLFFMPVTGRETVTPRPTVAETLKPIYAFEHTLTATSYSFVPTATRRQPDKPAPSRTPRPPTATATVVPTMTKPPTSTPITPTPIPPSPTDLPTKDPTPTSDPAYP